MKILIKAHSNGTGESQLKDIYKKKMVELNNIPITETMIFEFFLAAKIKSCSVNLSNRKTKNRWGTAWTRQNRMTIYRHSVGVFLHEFAHIFVNRDRKLGESVKAHGKEFARSLEGLMDKWETKMLT